MNDAILDRVRKLLSRTSERGCTQQEAETAYALASKLLAEHNLSMADVSEEREEWTEAEAIQTGRVLMEHNLAYQIVREFFFVKGLVRSKPLPGKPRNQSFVLFGKKENVETATFIYNSLLSAFDRLFESAKIAYGLPQKDRRTFVAGVYQGFYDKLTAERRVMEIERDASDSTGKTGTALALVSINQQVEKKFAETYKNLTKNYSSYTSPSGSTRSYNTGYAAGQNLNLNRGLTQGHQKKIDRKP